MSIPNSLTLSSPNSPPGQPWVQNQLFNQAVSSSPVGWLPADGLLVTGTLFSVELARLWVDFLQCLLLTSSSWTPPCSTLLLYRSVLTTTASLLFCFQAGLLPAGREDKLWAPELCSWCFPDMLAVSAAQLGILPLAHEVSGPHWLWDC